MLFVRSITFWVACYVFSQQVTVMFITPGVRDAAGIDCHIIGDLPLGTVQKGTHVVTASGGTHLRSRKARFGREDRREEGLLET